MKKYNFLILSTAFFMLTISGAAYAQVFQNDYSTPGTGHLQEQMVLVPFLSTVVKWNFTILPVIIIAFDLSNPKAKESS